jgi:hypothetical protein
MLHFRALVRRSSRLETLLASILGMSRSERLWRRGREAYFRTQVQARGRRHRERYRGANNAAAANEIAHVLKSKRMRTHGFRYHFSLGRRGR